MLNNFKILVCLLFLSLTVSFCSSNSSSSNAGVALLALGGNSNSSTATKKDDHHHHHYDSKIDMINGFADNISETVVFKFDRVAHGETGKKPSTSRWHRVLDFRTVTFHDNTNIVIGIGNATDTIDGTKKLNVTDSINSGNNVITIGTFTIAPKASRNGTMGLT